MLASSGESTAPCGVPIEGSVTTPCSRIPALSHRRISRNTHLSRMRRPTASLSCSKAMESKQAFRSKSHNLGDAPHGVVSAAFGSKAVGTRQEVGFEYRFDYQFHRRLHHTVSNDENSQRSILPGLSGLRYVLANNHFRPITLRPKLRFNSVQKALHSLVLDVVQRLSVRSGSTARCLHSLPHFFQHIASAHLVI